MKMDVIEAYQKMLDRFNKKRDLHQKAHIYYKNRDIKIFTIPLMIVQFICSILPQIDEIVPVLENPIGIMSSALAALSAIWLGFQGKKKYGERSESHKNAAAIFQHLAVLCMIEKFKAKVKADDNMEKFFAFQDMVQKLEGKAKDDEYLVPIKIKKAHKLEKERENSEKEKLRMSSEKEMRGESLSEGSALPAIMNKELPAIIMRGPHV